MKIGLIWLCIFLLVFFSYTAYADNNIVINVVSFSGNEIINSTIVINNYGVYFKEEYDKSIEDESAINHLAFHMPSGQSGCWLKGKNQIVYTGPGTTYYRDGKAMVSTADTVEVIAFDKGWVLIEYDIIKSAGKRRGYIPESSVDFSRARSNNERVIKEPLPFGNISASTNKSTACYDDMLKVRDPIVILPNNTEVLYIAQEIYPYPRANWAYVEFIHPNENIRVRGFIPFEDLTFSSVQ